MKYLLFLLMCLSVSAYAEVYKWVDADGKVHYGDRPNSGSAQEVKIESAPSPTGGSKDTLKNQKDIDSWLKARDAERRDNKKKQAALKKEQAMLKQKCVALKNELSDLEHGGVVWYELDQTGKRRYYSDKEIALEIEALKKTIKRNCPR
jgi:hypothetical protein